MNDILSASAPFRDPHRPPTPPKEHTSDPSSGIKPDHIVPSRSSLYTPDESPSSSAELSDGLSTSRKRVKISGNTLYYPLTSNGAKGYDSDELRALPRSRDCKSTKSILKLRSDHTASKPGNEQSWLHDTSLQAMLRSANRHLSNDTHSSSLDAYSTLSACLSTYDTLSKSDDIGSQVQEIVQYLKRDILKQPAANDSADSRLIVPALRIVILLLASSECSRCMPDDFNLFLTDQAIAGLENVETPKVILAQFMHVMEKQKFGPKVITVDRIQKLLLALDRLDKHARSPRIAAHRLMIYKRLLQQARPIMAAKVLIWLRHLIGGLVSNVKDIRLRAISFGVEAGLQVGSASNVSRACVDILEQKNRDDQSLIRKIFDRSVKMVNHREDPDQVPQIWSIIILLLRSLRSKIEQWDHFDLWKEIVQLCFKSSHIQTQNQAHIAVNRLIFVINVDTISNTMDEFLKELMVTQLTQSSHFKSGEKKVSISKESARSTYCTLLYTFLHPAASHAHLDHYWDLFVEEILTTCLSGSKGDRLFSYEILSALLFYQGPPRVWNEKQAITTGQVLPTELLNIDPRWIRSRATKITSTLRRFSSMSAWFEDGQRVTSLFRLWRHFISAIGNASSKEVRVSNETVVALSSLMNQMKALSNDGRCSQVSPDELLEILYFFLDEMASKIGVLPLNEKRLALTAEDSFEAISDTPSSRMNVKYAAANSLGFHLIRLILDAEGGGNDLKVQKLLEKVISLAIQTTHSQTARLKIIRGLCQSFFQKTELYALHTTSLLWMALVEACSAILKSRQTSETTNESPYPTQELFDAVRILEPGVTFLDEQLMNLWQLSIEQIASLTSKEIGSLGNAYVLEPLCNAICAMPVKERMNTSLHAATNLLDQLFWPHSTQAFDRMRAKLWESNGENKKLPIAGLPEGCFALANFGLGLAYSNLNMVSPDANRSLLAAVVSLIHRCPPYWKAAVVGKLQAQLAVWFEDSDESLKKNDSDIVSRQVEHLWAAVVAVLDGATNASSDLLSQTHLVLTAGLRSRCKRIVNDAVLVWNRTFGGIEDLECTQDLSSALRRLSSIADIEMNGLQFRPSQSDQPAFALLESQPTEAPTSSIREPTTTLKQSLSLFLANNSLSKHQSDFRSSAILKESKNTVQHCRSTKTTPRTKLRHDDSQIQFAPIESSPLAEDECTLPLLTERQQEVMDRQNDEAALFPQFQPSLMDGPPRNDPTLPAFKLKSRGRRTSFQEMAEASSPILPSLEIPDGVLGSSPTPSSSRHRSEERSLDEEIPSSPPFIVSQPPRNQSTEKATMQCLPTNPTLLSSKKAEILEPVREEISGATADADVHSDHEVFVDAPSEPLKVVGPSTRQVDSEARQGDRYLTGILQVSKMDREPIHGNPGLVDRKDCDKTTSNISQDNPLLHNRKRKRKLNADDRVSAAAARSNKRRTNPVVRSSKADKIESTTDIVADCVLIDSRPLDGVFQSVSPQKEPKVKQEREESPTLAEIASILQATSASQPRSSGRIKTVPMTKKREPSPEASMVRRTGRQARIQEKPDGEDRRIIGRRRTVSNGSSNASEPAVAPTGVSLDLGGSPRSVSEDPVTSTFLPMQNHGSDAQNPSVSSHTSQGKDLVQGFRSLLDRLQHVSLQTEEKDELMELLLRTGLETQAAARRALTS